MHQHRCQALCLLWVLYNFLLSEAYFVALSLLQPFLQRFMVLMLAQGSPVLADACLCQMTQHESGRKVTSTSFLQPCQMVHKHIKEGRKFRNPTRTCGKWIAARRLVLVKAALSITGYLLKVRGCSGTPACFKVQAECPRLTLCHAGSHREEAYAAGSILRKGYPGSDFVNARLARCRLSCSRCSED